MGPGICKTPGCGKPRHYKETKFTKIGLKKYYRPDCHACHSSKEANKKRLSKTELANSKHVSRKYRKSYCENADFRLGIECKGFAHEWQLQVDHIDSNPKNNNPWNFQTLCCNCHRYKSRMDEIHDIEFAKRMERQIEKNKAEIHATSLAVSLERFMIDTVLKRSGRGLVTRSGR